MNQNQDRYRNIHKELIEKCRKRDQTAQFELYKLYYKSMYNASLRIVQNPSEAEDIMQEAFLTAFSKIDTYKGEVSFGAWLKKIVINRSIDYSRSRKVRFEKLDEETEDVWHNDDEGDSEINVKLTSIRKAINMLSDGYRVVLSLYLIEGYDHDEIGQILNISSSGSRSQFTRAKQKLVELLKIKK